MELHRTLPTITNIIEAHQIGHYPQLPPSLQTKQSSIAAALLLAIVVMKLMQQHRGAHIESELFATTGALFSLVKMKLSNAIQCNAIQINAS